MLRPNTQTRVQFDEQTSHPNDEAEVEKIDPNSSMLALASLSSKLLKDVNQMDILASDQDISPEDPLPTVNLDPPSIEISAPWDCNESPEPCTPLQPTLSQLTSKLTQSTKQNEVHVKLISELREENKQLWIQIKNMEDLHKTIRLSQRDQK